MEVPPMRRILITALSHEQNNILNSIYPPDMKTHHTSIPVPAQDFYKKSNRHNFHVRDFTKHENPQHFTTN